MYSRGSVIPLFIEQLRAGRPLTLTEPAMTRFLMSLDQSVGLVLHAFSHAEPGDLFVWKAPATTVDTLARAVASLMGVEDPEIAVIGSRHGEKLHETLLSVEEMVKSEDQGEYFRVPLDARGLQYELYFEEGDRRVPRDKDFTSANTTQLGLEATKELLLTVPEVRAEAEAGL
jgi:UDP-glucose 4-epimerase